MAENRLPDPHPRAEVLQPDSRWRWQRCPKEAGTCYSSAAPPAPAGAKALWPLLGIWKAQVGPTCREAAMQHGVGTGPRQEQGCFRLPALLSLGSSKQKPLAPGSPCPTALTNALNVVAKAPAVPPAAFTLRNNQVSRLIAAAGCSQYSGRLLPWALPPGSQAVPTSPSTLHLCLPVTQPRPPALSAGQPVPGFVSWVVPMLLPPKLVGSGGVESQASTPSRGTA